MASGSAKRRLAVVLFNLGGPDSLEAVRPFLFNLFRDPAIIQAPSPLRYLIAALISVTRTKSAQANYARMGGASPLLPETEAQAKDLTQALHDTLPGYESKVFIAMRYWKPFTEQAAAAVKAFEPDDVVLLPLYPQFSTTTSASSLAAWRKAYRGPGVVRSVCCYPLAQGLIEAHADQIRSAWTTAGSPSPIRLLFSAHGLPETVVKGGDPYQVQIEATASAVADQLGPGWDWKVCYQSRVGPLKWIGPSTVEAIQEAAADGLGVLVTPIAFVSEHIETLVELDHEYAILAEEAGCPLYLRAPALGLAPAFIAMLAKAVSGAAAQPEGVQPGSAWQCSGWRQCPAGGAAEGMGR